MGTWGVKIFENDTAMDVLTIFNRFIEEIKDPKIAVNSLIQTGWVKKDITKDDPDAIFAIAEIKRIHGILVEKTKQKAIELIKQEEDRGWKNWEARKKELNNFKRRLNRNK